VLSKKLGNLIVFTMACILVLAALTLGVTSMCSQVKGAEPGLYYVDPLFLGTGTGYGTPDDILRDLNLDVTQLSDLSMPGWYVYNNTLSAMVTGMWSGRWDYSDGLMVPDLLVVDVDDAWAAYCVRDWARDPCPVGTIDFVGTWDTDDLGGQRVTHLSLFKGVRDMPDRSCEVPEPAALIMVVAGLMAIAFLLIVVKYL